MADYGMLQQAVKSNYGSSERKEKDGLEKEKRFVMDEDNYSKLDPPKASSALVVNARVTVKGKLLQSEKIKYKHKYKTKIPYKF